MDRRAVDRGHVRGEPRRSLQGVDQRPLCVESPPRREPDREGALFDSHVLQPGLRHARGLPADLPVGRPPAEVQADQGRRLPDQPLPRRAEVRLADRGVAAHEQVVTALYTLIIAPRCSTRSNGRMKALKVVLVAAMLVAAAAPGLADARGFHGGHGGFHGRGFGLGVGLGLAIGVPLLAASYYAPPYYAPPYYAPPYYAPAYYAPPAAYAPAYDYTPPPQQYSQPAYAPQAPAPVQQASSAWYFCPSSKGY